MSGPGEYVADPTEGITRVEDLPKAKVVPRTRNFVRRRCPKCGRSCYRHRTRERTLHDLGDLLLERPRDVHLTYSQHYCCKCHRYFNVDSSDLAPHNSHDTHRVIALAVQLVVEDGLPYRMASWHLWRDHRVFVPYATTQNWVEAGGKKAEEHVRGRYLDVVLTEFSGYIAADELYDGPFCVLSIVDNRTFRRIIYEVLDHNPRHADIERFFCRFQSLLPPTPSNAATAVTERCRRTYTASALNPTSLHESPWTCSVKNELPSATSRQARCTLGVPEKLHKPPATLLQTLFSGPVFERKGAQTRKNQLRLT